MKQLIECVPNFSEGSNIETLYSIAEVIGSLEGVSLLHQDSGVAANRTVFTFAGEVKAVFEAAFKAIKIASEKIDMRKQRGQHPRIGACDVCPFVPIANISAEELIPLVEDFAKKVARELDVPCYLYEQSAKNEKRKNLANHRIGNYENLRNRVESKKWLPDFGRYNARTGGTIIGVRNFLIAYNINLVSKDARLAQEIAYELREVGRPIKKVKGKMVYQPGKLKQVKAIGWYIEDFDIAQVSVNLTDYKKTPIHLVYETSKQIAEGMGIEVSGSELIGLIPKEALVQAGKFYSKESEKATDDALIKSSIQALGLSDLKPFEPNKRILEYLLEI